MNDTEFRQAVAVLDAYQRQLEALAGQAEVMRMSLEDSLRARETLQAVAASKAGDGVLVPIGAGTFMHANVSKKKTAIVSVGSRVCVEKDLKGAIEFTKSNIDEITEALKKADSAMRELDEAIRKLSVAVQQEYDRRQQ